MSDTPVDTMERFRSFDWKDCSIGERRKLSCEIARSDVPSEYMFNHYHNLYKRSILKD